MGPEQVWGTYVHCRPRFQAAAQRKAQREAFKASGQLAMTWQSVLEAQVGRVCGRRQPNRVGAVGAHGATCAQLPTDPPCCCKGASCARCAQPPAPPCPAQPPALPRPAQVDLSKAQRMCLEEATRQFRAALIPLTTPELDSPISLLDPADPAPGSSSAASSPRAAAAALAASLPLSLA